MVLKMKGALLLSVGDKDGASDWHQDIEMYNMARREGKQCIMLVYPGKITPSRSRPTRWTTIAAFSTGSIIT